MTVTEFSPRRDLAPPLPRTLALGAIAGPVLFTLAWVVLGFFNHGYTLFGYRIPAYSPISQPISGLGMGATAPYMNTAFVVTGLLLVAGIIGVFSSTAAANSSRLRVASAALLLLIPAGCIIDGLFHLNQMMPHTIGFLLATGSPVGGFLAAGLYFRRIPRERKFGAWLLVASPVTLVLLVAFFATFTPTAGGTQHGVAGLVQRILVIEVFTYLVLMGLRAHRGHGVPDMSR